MKINEYGVFRGEESIAGRTEKDVYAALGLPVFPPELREGRREFEWADEEKLPELVELEDMRGDLHMHTDATDGKATLEEMIAAAQRAAWPTSPSRIIPNACRWPTVWTACGCGSSGPRSTS